MYRSRRSSDDAAGCTMGCGVMALVIVLNLALLGAAVWVVATVIKAVFGL